MSNQMFNILSGALYDQLAETTNGQPLGAIDPETLRGSMSNPLQALRLLSMDVETDCSFDSEALAKAVGVPSDWLDADRLVAPIEEVIPALGRLALIYLSSLRNQGFSYIFESDARENALGAVATFSDVLEMNAKLRRPAH